MRTKVETMVHEHVKGKALPSSLNLCSRDSLGAAGAHLAVDVDHQALEAQLHHALAQLNLLKAEATHLVREATHCKKHGNAVVFYLAGQRERVVGGDGDRPADDHPLVLHELVATGVPAASA